MEKYSIHTKKKVVMAYLNGQGSYEDLAVKYGIRARQQICKWVHAFNKFGDEGLMRSRKNTTYPFDFKLHVVQLYLSTDVSYQELALSKGMNNSTSIMKWVNDFRIAGPDALRSKKKGREKPLGSTNNNKRIVSVPKNPSPDKDSGRLKQLEDENLKLRIENAYLKELRRLRLEDEARLRERQESSTASEETSN